MRGIKQIEEALILETYPMDDHGIAYAIGDLGVEVEPGDIVLVRDLIDLMGATSFADADEVMSGIERALNVRKSQESGQARAA